MGNKEYSRCKDMPKSLVKYINMQTCICPSCKKGGRITRCSIQHLEKEHKISIPTTDNLIDIIQKEQEVVRKVKDETETEETLTKREKLLNIAEGHIQNNICKLQEFLIS